MAVLVERQQCYCPDCNELLSYSSADAQVVKSNSHTVSYDSRRRIPMIKTTVTWFITCPTCKRYFKVKEFSKARNA